MYFNKVLPLEIYDECYLSMSHMTITVNDYLEVMKVVNKLFRLNK